MYARSRQEDRLLLPARVNNSGHLLISFFFPRFSPLIAFVIAETTVQRRQEGTRQDSDEDDPDDDRSGHDSREQIHRVLRRVHRAVQE